MPPSEKVKKIHHGLIVQMNKIFSPDSDMFTELKRLANAYLKGGVLDRCKDMNGLLDKLQNAGHIKAGDYTKLKEMIREAECDRDDCLDLVEEAEENIRLANLASSNDQASTSRGTRRSETDPGPPESKAKRMKLETSDGLTDDTTVKSRYNISKGRGLCLILNFFSEDRDDTDKDVKALTEFLESVNCEVNCEHDLGLEQVKGCLAETQTQLNRDFGPKYEYFICAILSHGDKDGINTMDDKRISMDEIARTFRNDKIPKFADKPRVFLVQACRGKQNQGAVDVSDDEIRDIADIVGDIKVPTDSDILLAYATTPGMKAWRRTGKGSWFIHEFVKVVKSEHQTEHLEEMLITVKENVAKYSTQDGVRQMPCSWSTLTKRLYI